MTIRYSLLALGLGAVAASATFAMAASEGSALRIKVTNAESHQIILSADQAPQECDQINYSGYCHGARTQTTQNVMTIEDSGGQSYRVTCTVDTRWSKCESLVVGTMYDGRMEKHGITIYYVNDGKLRKQLYTFVTPKKEASRVVAASKVSPAAAALPSILEPAQVASVPARTQPAPAQVTQASTPAHPVAQTSSPAVIAENPRETVKCNFTSIPPGADITIDGRYFGNTPSVLGLTTGSHVVTLFAPGFAQWKKELTVVENSEVNVSAILQKTQ
jgi:hypothetical protein